MRCRERSDPGLALLWCGLLLVGDLGNWECGKSRAFAESFWLKSLLVWETVVEGRVVIATNSCPEHRLLPKSYRQC